MDTSSKQRKAEGDPDGAESDSNENDNAGQEAKNEDEGEQSDDNSGELSGKSSSEQSEAGSEDNEVEPYDDDDDEEEQYAAAAESEENDQDESVVQEDDVQVAPKDEEEKEETQEERQIREIILREGYWSGYDPPRNIDFVQTNLDVDDLVGMYDLVYFEVVSSPCHHRGQYGRKTTGTLDLHWKINEADDVCSARTRETIAQELENEVEERVLHGIVKSDRAGEPPHFCDCAFVSTGEMYRGNLGYKIEHNSIEWFREDAGQLWKVACRCISSNTSNIMGMVSPQEGGGGWTERIHSV